MRPEENSMLRAIARVSTYGLTGDGRRLPLDSVELPQPRSPERHASSVRTANRARRRRKGW